MSDVSGIKMHFLPMNRVHEAYDKAASIGRELGLPNGAAREITKAVIAILEAGTSRWGITCPVCSTAVAYIEGQSPTCPTHGSLVGRMGTSIRATLLIAYEPTSL